MMLVLYSGEIIYIVTLSLEPVNIPLPEVFPKVLESITAWTKRDHWVPGSDGILYIHQHFGHNTRWHYNYPVARKLQVIGIILFTQ